jgi:hypothetical protein
MLAYKSKWGFHPCNREQFLKLKELNKLAFKAICQAAAWQRWNRKKPINRVMRPKIRNSEGHVVGYQAPIPLAEPPVSSMFYYIDTVGSPKCMAKIVKAKPFLKQVMEDYRNARHPVAEESLVKPLNLTYELLAA